MVFASHIFIFYFLPTALLLYYLVPRKSKHLILTIVSYIFYGWANPWYILLILASTAVDYLCGLMIAGRITLFPSSSHTQRRLAVFISVVTNLSLLGFFKYFAFAQSNLNAILQAFGREAFEVLRITLPVGISFYTFQSMSYTIDLYRGHARPANSFVDFACYVSMFPQLVAGPIVRYSDIADQLIHRTCTLEKFSRGMIFFILGFAKKVLLANPMGEVADASFNAGSLTWYDAWIGVIAYAFQIYFDFSGYSDMAIGLGLMLGFQFSKNFDSPYHAESITSFWRRWHISLSSWLRDYLYIPLGGNRKGRKRTYFNLMTVMLLGGLWHGAQWKFVIWGGIHGCMLAFERMLGKESPYRFLPRAFRVMITFTIILITWVFFRADSLREALRYLGYMFGLKKAWHTSLLLGSIIYTPYHLIIMFTCAAVTWFGKQSWDFAQSGITPLKLTMLIPLFILTLATLFTQGFNPFLYFQF